MLSKGIPKYLYEMAAKATNPQVEILKQLADRLITEIENISQKRTLIFGESFNLDQEVEQFEVNLIRHALLISNGNQRRAARMLGVNTTTLNNKIKKYKIGGKFQAVAK